MNNFYRALRFVDRPLALVLLGLIRIYQRTLSPMLGDVCRYYPSCSRYTYGAISTHGAFKGTMLGVVRILRCNPWAKGGIDHVPDFGAWVGSQDIRVPLESYAVNTDVPARESSPEN